MALPQPGDDAVVQIHDFISYCLELLEARYGDRTHRSCQDRSRDSDQGNCRVLGPSNKGILRGEAVPEQLRTS